MSILRCKSHVIVPNISGTCAVVGSSDSLRVLPMGVDIDKHGTVWRVNNAPEIGFEAWVGHNTHIRVINHVAIDVWTNSIAPKLEGRASHRGREFPREICIGRRCLLIDTDQIHLQRLARLPNNMTIQALHGIRKTVGRCAGTTRSLSAGYISVILALWSCPRPVHLYGFMPHCCDHRRHREIRQRFGWPYMNYKYSHTNNTKWVCCASGRENMAVEFENYLSMEKQGILKLHPYNGLFIDNKTRVLDFENGIWTSYKDLPSEAVLRAHIQAASKRL